MKQLELDFKALLQRNQALIYSVCMMFASPEASADDLAQEALINLWRGFPDFRADSSENTWIYSVTLNTCISYNRKRRRKPDSSAPVESVATAIVEDSGVMENTRVLYDRIHGLPPLDRAIVLLWLECLPYEDIGAIMGISAKAVGVRLVRIKEKLKTKNNG